MFADPEDLAAWLREHGVAMEGWGQSGTKTAVDLWIELQEGDALLEGPPPMRIVNVVQVLISHQGRELFEVAQELAGGHERRRNRLPSEKVKTGESAAAAAARCLQEELGLQRGRFSVDSTPITLSEMEEDSPSYPGLATRYTLVTVPATAVGLPDEPFWRDNSAAAQGDPVRRHLWAWRQAD